MEYYAGYSSLFVRDVIKYLKLPVEATILDPWNGSGTTTKVGYDLGYKTIGLDLNPAMVVAATARFLDPGVKGSLSSLLDDIIRKSVRYKDADSSDPLSAWLYSDSIKTLRGIERAITNLLVSSTTELKSVLRSDGVSTLAAFFYLGLFKTVRTLLKPFRGSNPTWIKKPKSSNQKLRPSPKTIIEEFTQQLNQMIDDLGFFPLDPSDKTLFKLAVASSTSLPLQDNSCDAVISSPPYCTRIDYVISTLPELATLGFSQEEIDELRDSMIGTPTIVPNSSKKSISFGAPCDAFLLSVLKHESYAASTYYYKTFLQYFTSMKESLHEIDRVVKPSGSCTLVVQDSYFKNIHLDLPSYITSMARDIGWHVEKKEDHQINTLALINANSKKYEHKGQAIESVLVFSK